MYLPLWLEIPVKILAIAYIVLIIKIVYQLGKEIYQSIKK